MPSLWAIKERVKQIGVYIDAANQEIAAQYGGLAKHVSIKAIIDQLAATDSVAESRHLHKQLAGFHAVQFAERQGKARDMIAELVGDIDKMFHLDKKGDNKAGHAKDHEME